MALSINVDSALQSQAKETFTKIGLPFDNNINCYNEETRQAIEEIERGEGLSKTFDSVDELMKDLMKDA